MAAFLNLFFGIGYFYLGYKKVAGIRTFGFVLVVLIVYILGIYFTFGILTLLLAIFMAVDGFQKADGEKGFIGAE